MILACVELTQDQPAEVVWFCFLFLFVSLLNSTLVVCCFFSISTQTPYHPTLSHPAPQRQLSCHSSLILAPTCPLIHYIFETGCSRGEPWTCESPASASMYWDASKSWDYRTVSHLAPAVISGIPILPSANTDYL